MEIQHSLGGRGPHAVVGVRELSHHVTYCKARVLWKLWDVVVDFDNFRKKSFRVNDLMGEIRCQMSNGYLPVQTWTAAGLEFHFQITHAQTHTHTHAHKHGLVYINFFKDA